jgi:hypothetical protein
MGPDAATALASSGIFLLGGLVFVHVGRQFRHVAQENREVATANDLPWKLFAMAFLVLALQAAGKFILVFFFAGGGEQQGASSVFFVGLSTLNNMLFLSAGARIPYRSGYLRWFRGPWRVQVGVGLTVVALSIVLSGLDGIPLPGWLNLNAEIAPHKIPDALLSVFTVFSLTIAIARGLVSQGYSGGWAFLFVLSQVIMAVCQTALALDKPPFAIAVCNVGSAFNLLLALVLLGLWLVNEERQRLKVDGQQAASSIDGALELLEKLEAARDMKQVSKLASALREMLISSQQHLPFEWAGAGDDDSRQARDLGAEKAIVRGERLFERISGNLSEWEGAVAIDMRGSPQGRVPPKYFVAPSIEDAKTRGLRDFGRGNYYVVELDPWYRPRAQGTD